MCYLSLRPVKNSNHHGLSSLRLIQTQLLALLRPKWARFQTTARLVIGSIGLIVCYLLLRAGNLVELTDAARNYPGVDSLTWWIVGISITASIYIGLSVWSDSFGSDHPERTAEFDSRRQTKPVPRHPKKGVRIRC